MKREYGKKIEDERQKKDGTPKDAAGCKRSLSQIKYRHQLEYMYK
jgi:hypothetical protein